MSLKTKKILFGLLAILPTVMCIVGIFGVIAGALEGLDRAIGRHGEDNLLVDFLVQSYLIGTYLLIVSTVVFALHALLNTKMSIELRIVWPIAIVLLSGIAQIFYYFIYIFRDSGKSLVQDGPPTTQDKEKAVV